MKITITRLPQLHRVPATRGMPIEMFADEHRLAMEITERSSDSRLPPYCASFERAEVKDGALLCGIYGDGYSPEDAIKAYARNISGQLLVVDAYGENRREIYVPILI